MKSFIDKFFNHTSRFEFFLLVIPFILWVYCFHHFFTGKLWLEVDAISYADHIRFYVDNLSRGVFPLWDSTWLSGAPNDFFLRRIGDVNPLLFVIVFFKWVGVPLVTAYLIFLGFYYFLAGWAFYLIARFLFTDRFFAFSAYILLLFSSWGSEIFYNYIIIIFVPIIWFFYFLLCFAKTPRKGYLLGMCLCVGLVVTTYIPFFFLTILMVFSFFYILFYGGQLLDVLKRSSVFFCRNKIFTFMCIFFLLAACIPALIFYKESKSGEFVLPGRHLGADTSSAVGVGIENVAVGDIISHGFFDRLFDDQQRIDMGDIYLPYIFFLMLLMTLGARINTLIFFLLFNMLALFLITITSAGGMHRFLYEHIGFFKFIRNIYYFFWLAILPMGILLAVAAFKSLLSAINASQKKILWLAYIGICHLIFMVFLFTHSDVPVGAWVAVLFSLLYFVLYCLMNRKISYLAGFCLFLLAVFIQSSQVYGFLDSKLFKMQKNVIYFDQLQKDAKPTKMGLYYASNWFSVLVEYIDPQVLDNYRNHPFVLYDNVIPYVESPAFFKSLQDAMTQNVNVAFLPRLESKDDDWRSDRDANPQADLDPVHSGRLSIIYSDTNTWVIKAHLQKSEFLVINDNYNSGWHASINGRPAHLFRANVSFKGLWVPAGESRIVLRFSTFKSYVLHFVLMAFFAGVFLCLLILLKKDSTQRNMND